MDNEELFALRAFLQRGETRLGSMHAIAGAYIGGAGLLILIPLFFRDYIGPIVNLFFREIDNGLISISAVKSLSPDVLLTLWVLPFLCVLGIPIYALYLLIQELVVLYFIPYSRSEGFYLPRFALSALAMPLDDPRGDPREIGKDDEPAVSRIKSQIIRQIYASDVWNAVPADQNHPEWGNLARVGRRFPGIVNTLKQRRDARFRTGGDVDSNISWIYDVRAGKAGLTDRTLIDDAARLETTLVRVNARLRVMAIRYFKSLLVLIWTLILLSILTAVLRYFELETETGDQISLAKLKHVSEIVCLAIAIMWACLTPIVVNSPLRWIRKTGDRNLRFARHRDVDLSRFELVVFLCCTLSFLVSAPGLIFGIGQIDLDGAAKGLATWMAWGIIVATFYSLIRAAVRLAR
jgi:hypothetical protein